MDSVSWCSQLRLALKLGVFLFNAESVCTVVQCSPSVHESIYLKPSVRMCLCMSRFRIWLFKRGLHGIEYDQVAVLANWVRNYNFTQRGS